jgi:hypothetical protein
VVFLEEYFFSDVFRRLLAQAGHTPEELLATGEREGFVQQLVCDGESIVLVDCGRCAELMTPSTGRR